MIKGLNTSINQKSHRTLVIFFDVVIRKKYNSIDGGISNIITLIALIPRSLDDSFVLVVIMLLGELDYASLVETGNNTLVVKIVFLLFIMMMSIVLINLIIGLSINDIASLRWGFILKLISQLFVRKEANIHKLINTVSAIKSVENLNMIISFVFPRLRNNTRVTSDTHTGHMIDDQVQMFINVFDDFLYCLV